MLVVLQSQRLTLTITQPLVLPTTMKSENEDIAHAVVVGIRRIRLIRPLDKVVQSNDNLVSQQLKIQNLSQFKRNVSYKLQTGEVHPTPLREFNSFECGV